MMMMMVVEDDLENAKRLLLLSIVFSGYDDQITLSGRELEKKVWKKPGCSCVPLD